jgi:hypothetical protein
VEEAAMGKDFGISYAKVKEMAAIDLDESAAGRAL